MGFTSDNEISIVGGSEVERRRAALLFLAPDCVDEDSLSQGERPDALVLRFDSVDGLPEADLAFIAAQFPELSFALAYFSKDGEFFGYARAGAGGEAAESDDLDEALWEEVGRRHNGDGIAFVKEQYSL
jgi:hypothetical protein